LKSYRWLPLMLLALGALVAAPACAVRVSTVRADYHPPFQERAFNEGHRRGLERGRDDARRGRAIRYEAYKEYRNADSGYRRGDRDREAYREIFRQGFRAGYDEAFNRRGDRDDRGRRR